MSCSLFNFKFIWFRNFILKFSRAKNCILHNLIKKWYDFFMLTIALISGIFFNFKFIVNQCVFLPVFRHAIHLPVRISFTLNKMIFFTNVTSNIQCQFQTSLNLIHFDCFWWFVELITKFKIAVEMGKMDQKKSKSYTKFKPQKFDCIHNIEMYRRHIQFLAKFTQIIRAAAKSVFHDSHQQLNTIRRIWKEERKKYSKKTKRKFTTECVSKLLSSTWKWWSDSLLGYISKTASQQFFFVPIASRILYTIRQIIKKCFQTEIKPQMHLLVWTGTQRPKARTKNPVPIRWLVREKTNTVKFLIGNESKMLLHFEQKRQQKSDTEHDKRGIEIQVCHHINGVFLVCVGVWDSDSRVTFLWCKCELKKKLLQTPNKLKTYLELKTMVTSLRCNIFLHLERERERNRQIYMEVSRAWKILTAK